VTIAFNRQIEEQLCRLQLAMTQDTIWRTSNRLLRAAMPFDGLIGIRYYVGRPMLLRTTHPVADESGYLNRLAEVGLCWGEISPPGPRVDVRRLSDVRTDVALDGWPYFEEFLRPRGWRHLAGLLFWGQRGDFLGQLALHRTAAQGDFRDDEIALLQRLQPHIHAAVARLQKLDDAHSGRWALERVLRPLPLHVVIANWAGQIEFLNRAGREALHCWKWGASEARARSPEPMQQLPPDIADACRRLRRRYEDFVQRNPSRTFTGTEQVLHSKTEGACVDVSILPADFRLAIHPAFLIDLHFSELPPPGPASTVEYLTRLTPSERAVVRLISEGASNAEVATKLGVSQNTVRTHLRHIFDKLGLNSRAKLAVLFRPPYG
jgi:DNA-binding CsgD family transcriptional regulator